MDENELFHVDFEMLVLYQILLLSSVFGEQNIQNPIIFGDEYCGALTFEVGNFLDTLLPKNTTKSDVLFHLYNRKSLENPTELDNHNVELLNNKLETKIVVHGWLENSRVKWSLKMKDTYLKKKDYNIIIVDYSHYSRRAYGKAVKSMDIVGRKIASFLAAAKNGAKLNLNKVHLIGFSLGAHICGSVANHLKKVSKLYQVNRITGLDPAGPKFSRSCLKKKAKFVDVYHTGAIFFGVKKKIGRADYYVNGGYVQPGCRNKETSLETLSGGFGLVHQMLEFTENFCSNIFDRIACNHMSSTWYWISSINSEEYHESNRGKVKIGEHADPTLTGKVSVKNVQLVIPDD